jgi:predicted glycosyltransferase involved in capsule biosynthesis
MNIYWQKIKNILPIKLKFPFWFVFKAPQRAQGWHTFPNDLKGILVFIFRNILPKRTLQPISICTGMYNRSDNYISQLIASLNQSNHKELITLSVVDCFSNDIPYLEESIRKQWSGKLIFSQDNGAFARSRTFNKAVNQAPSSLVFICDADLSLPPNIVELCNNYVGAKLVWYPIYFFLFNKKPTKVHKDNGIWEQYGSKGMFACMKADYQKIGGLDEAYTAWGHEDTELWERFHQQGYVIIRNQQPNFLHHWHNTFNPKYKHMNSDA